MSDNTTAGRAWVSGTGTYSIPFRFRPKSASIDFVPGGCGPMPPPATCDIEIVNLSSRPVRPRWVVQFTWDVSAGIRDLEYTINL